MVSVSQERVRNVILLDSKTEQGRLRGRQVPACKVPSSLGEKEQILQFSRD